VQTFIQFLESYINFGDYRLEQKFHHYNQLLFNNVIPPCPIVWEDLKYQAGITRYMHRGTTFVPGSMTIAISNRFKRTEENLDSTLIHEMIHAYYAVTGYPKENHGFRFKTMAAHCGKIVGFEIPETDIVTNLEVASKNATETTFLMRKYNDGWYTIIYPGDPFGTHQKQTELSAFWGREGFLPKGTEILVIKMHSDLGHKYKSSRGVKVTKWSGINPVEAADILQHGHLIMKIVAGTIPADQARSMMPTKQVLVAMATNTRNGQTVAGFYVPTVAQSFNDLNLVRHKWDTYHKAGYNVEIFMSSSSLFTRGITMMKKPETSKYYMLKPHDVEELRKNAQLYYERWLQ